MGTPQAILRLADYLGTDEFTTKIEEFLAENAVKVKARPEDDEQDHQ